MKQLEDYPKYIQAITLIELLDNIYLDSVGISKHIKGSYIIKFVGSSDAADIVNQEYPGVVNTISDCYQVVVSYED